MKKYCTKCGHEFIAVGREVICPSCKAQATEEAKKAAVLRAKRASWTGESVPVRISGRASTVIREFGATHTMAFAEALDTLLRTSEYFANKGIKWEDVTPYKSHRRGKHTTETHDAQTAQDVSQGVTSKPQDKPQDKPASKPQVAPQTAQAAKSTSKSTSKTSTSKSTSKTSTSKSTSKTSTSKSTSK